MGNRTTSASNALPPPSPDVLCDRIPDALCDRFASAWKAGECPVLEDFWKAVPPPHRARMLRQLLAVEIACRRERGEQPRAPEYLERFPTCPEEVAAAFAVTAPVHQVETGPPLSEDEEEEPPRQLGRYRILARLGAGAFGVVYRGHDDELDRDVAIKVPQRRRVAAAEDVQAYMAEARILATLDHPGIVPVYDVGRTDDGLCYVVSKFVEGSDLAARLHQGRLALTEAVELVWRVCEALHHAHEHGLVHRDVKPANILLDCRGRPIVADFGLALREQDFGTGPTVAGTPAYMSPEQARGEGHRVDARTDVWSLGVVLYELLTGRRPFQGNTLAQVLEEIKVREPRPPRQLDAGIPRELDRICLKCLSKRMADRHSTALDLAEDLRHFQATEAEGGRVGEENPTGKPPSFVEQSAVVRVVPKGLRSFDAGDADFFLDLLPGPRDRDGLPEAIRFWKGRIEETDAENTFRVGLIYGPSGCGKSSLVKAGLLPRLAAHVVAVYVEAATEDTEARLLGKVRKHCPDLSPTLGLAESLAALRRGTGLLAGGKVLLVLDQFEQFLHARGEQGNTELAEALRQCDGGRVQAVLLVRDDFGMAATRFLHDLEVRIVEGDNFATVDLFDPGHAGKVLTRFGRAFGCLPKAPAPLEPDQQRFVEQAVAALAQDGRIVSVRLAVFAEMVKGWPWAPRALREVGGAEGVGVAFLEETLGDRTRNPERRRHARAAQSVLRVLLPEEGTDIKGHRRSARELLEASGYGLQPGEFRELLRVLDSELRLVTPTEAEEKDEGGRMKDEEAESPSDSSFNLHPSAFRYYQLTHDYLVPSLRDWLARKQKQTRRGRAQLRLAERAALWSARPENRRLPAAWEWLNIRLFARRRDWTRPQQQMMREADRYYALRGLVLALGALLLLWGVWEGLGRVRAAALRDRLLEATATEKVPDIVHDMTAYRRWLDAPLHEAYAHAEQSGDARRQLHASLALLPVDDRQVEYLKQRLLTAEPPEVLAIREMLRPQCGQISDWLWQVLERPASDPGQRLRVACTLAVYAPEDRRWQTVGDSLARKLVSENALVIGKWAEALEPVGPWLLAPLAKVLQEEGHGGAERRTILGIYVRFARERPDAAALFEKVLAEPGAAGAKLEARLNLARRQANAAAALAALGHWEKVLPLLAHSPDPTVRGYLIDRLGAVVEARPLAEMLEAAGEEPQKRALVLALGEIELDRLLPAEREPLIHRLLALYRGAPDPGMHAAAGWLLRQWGQQARTREIDDELKRVKPEGPQSWYVNGQGQTLVVLPRPGEVVLGEGPHEPHNLDGGGRVHDYVQARHRRRINRGFALAAREVTVAEFFRFRTQYRYWTQGTPSTDCPATRVTWPEAVAYCNWLSEKEGIPADQWCYVPNEKGGQNQGLKMAPDYLQRTGYRLPTEAEWEYACRAGALTSWWYGDAQDLLGKYAWFFDNSLGQLHPVGSLRPNDWGFFDMLGNATEWCEDRWKGDRAEDGSDDVEDMEDIQGYRGEQSRYSPMGVRVLRGDSIRFDGGVPRCAIRGAAPASDCFYTIGFRVAQTWR